MSDIFSEMKYQLSFSLSASAFLALCLFAQPACADDVTARIMRDVVAQSVPVGTPEKPLSAPGLPVGLNYTLDASVAFPYGNTGANARLPGGIDVVVGYGFSKKFRAQAAYYEFQEYPVGFNSGVVPVFLQGLGAPITRSDLSQANLDVTVKNKILVANASYLFVVGKKLPIVVSPTYIARSGTIGGHSDELDAEINGFPQRIRLRTVEYKLVAITVPFLSTPRMFGTLTAAPQWVVNTNGANRSNTAQIFELLYTEYRASPRTTFFFQPSRLINYLPPDPFPQYITTVIYGVSHKFTKNSFVQIVASTGAPTNKTPNGITSLTCPRIAANGQGCAVQPLASIGGLHAAQVQIQFGIGSPAVIPL